MLLSKRPATGLGHDIQASCEPTLVDDTIYLSVLCSTHSDCIRSAGKRQVQTQRVTNNPLVRRSRAQPSAFIRRTRVQAGRPGDTYRPLAEAARSRPLKHSFTTCAGRQACCISDPLRFWTNRTAPTPSRGSRPSRKSPACFPGRLWVVFLPELHPAVAPVTHQSTGDRTRDRARVVVLPRLRRGNKHT